MARTDTPVNDPMYIASLYQKMPEILATLGFDELRKGQDLAVASIFSGKDTIVILPTGMGKSAVYVVPTLAQNWKTLIFSPLVALIQDQLESLQRKGLKAAQMSSLQTVRENEQALNEWENGDLNFLIVAPERFNNERFMKVITEHPPNMITLDEAHCLSEWGDNFRADYVKVGEVIQKLEPEVVLTLTATCPASVEADIRRVLNLKEANKIVYMPKRENLIYESHEWLNDLQLSKQLNENDGPTIVYCTTVKEVERLYKSIGRSVKGEALIFHGQLKPSEKSSNLQMFMNDHARVMFATSAFGMGIDKPNIRNVIMRDVPQSIEAAVQAFGRGGRDGLPTKCVFYWDRSTERTQRFFLEMGYPPEEDFEKFIRGVKMKSDLNGICLATLGDICSTVGLNSYKAAAVMETLIGSNVIKRTTKENFFKVTILESHADARSQEYIDVIEEIGIPDDEGDYEVDLEFFKTKINKSMPTVKKNLQALHTNEYIVYTPPPKGNPMKLIGGLDKVDFPRIKIKEEFAYKKLADLKTFFNVPDSNKHDYVNDYFEN